ncbi:hypothetical protein D0T84_04825 [Dysgonomonas sp. 521]|nr:hypothetical protein [Dysgonomonas sp. 521]
MGFVSLILLVDFLLLQGEKSNWTAGMRVILSVTMGFIISLLTCLIVFGSDIKAKTARDIDTDVKLETETRKSDITYWKTLPDSINFYNTLSVTAHKGDYVTEHGQRVGKCKDFDQANCPKGTYCEVFRSKAEYFKTIYDNNKHLINDTTYITRAEQKAGERNSDGIIEQIKDLWELMMDEEVVLVGVILFFIFLMVIDLMPISVKFGIKDTLDNKYDAFLNKLRTERDASGNLRFYDVELEKFFLENEREKTNIEEEKQKETEKAKRVKAVIVKLEDVKKIYAENKLQHVVDGIKKWYTSSKLEKDAQTSEDTLNGTTENSRTTEENTFAQIKEFAQRIKNGEKIYSVEDLQFQLNYAAEIENELQKLKYLENDEHE